MHNLVTAPLRVSRHLAIWISLAVDRRHAGGATKAGLVEPERIGSAAPDRFGAGLRGLHP